MVGKLRHHRYNTRFSKTFEYPDYMKVKSAETSSLSSTSTSTPIQTNVEIANTEMDKLMKEMKSLDEKREIEIQNFKKKCENQETMISSIKKSIRMDKLEIDFETYKKDMEMRIKSLENSKLQLLNEKLALQRKYDATSKSLTTETSLRLSSTAAQRELQNKVDVLKKQLDVEKGHRKVDEEKVKIRIEDSTKQLEAEKALRKTDEEKLKKRIEDLTKQLEAEKVLRKTVENKVFSLESQIALNKVIPTPLTPVTPKPASDLDAGDVKPNTVTEGVKNSLLIPSIPYLSSKRNLRKRKSMGTDD